MRIIAEVISVVSIFRAGEAEPEPYMFRYQGEEIKVGCIMDITRTKTISIDAIEYLCSSIIGRVEKQYVLKYTLRDCRWELYKM